MKINKLRKVFKSAISPLPCSRNNMHREVARWKGLVPVLKFKLSQDFISRFMGVRQLE